MRQQAREFLDNYKYLSERIADCRAELENLTPYKSQSLDPTPRPTGHHSDPTATHAIKRQALQQRLAKYEQELEQYQEKICSLPYDLYIMADWLYHRRESPAVIARKMERPVSYVKKYRGRIVDALSRMM